LSIFFSNSFCLKYDTEVWENMHTGKDYLLIFMRNLSIKFQKNKKWFFMYIEKGKGSVMKKNSMKKYIFPLLLFVAAITVFAGAKQVSGAVRKLQSIEAIYTGQAVAIGESVNLKDFYVTATYYINDGFTESEDFEQVKKGFTVSPSVITRKGNNPVVVTYQGKTCVVQVEGKEVETLSATYTGDELFVGATIPVGKIEVYAYYTDGSYEKIRNFTLSTPTVLKAGVNTVSVIYEGKVEYIYVYGKAPLEVEEIVAYYVGDPVIAGNSISKGDIQVEAIYNDGTIKEITNFNISPSIAELEGENDITVSYGEVSTVIQVYGEPRYVTDMRARYIGPGVIIGKTVKKEEIEVIVTYNDNSDEAIDDYEIFGGEILYEGENVVLVYYDAFMADITVRGVKGFAANYDNAISNYFTSPDHYYYTEVTLGMNVGLDPDMFMLRKADSDMVEYVVQRVVPTDEFIGFDLFYDEDEMVCQFPMAMKVTVPSSFDPEKFGVYYTPNQSTIMAKVDGEFTDETQEEYEFIVYEPGVYILVHEVSNRLVTDIIVETEIKLRENRSYSLNPVVFPLSAENRDVSYWSTDEDVATVSPNGKIRTHSEGTCEIWIEAEDGSGVTAIVTVEVKNGK